MSAVQRTHAPAVTSHAGASERAAHCASALQRPQVRVVGLHTGVAASQSASVRHATQVLRVTSQSGGVPVHALRLVAVHSTHAPEVVLHAGVAMRGAHAVSAVHGPQARVVVLHTGAVAGQSASARHATQVFVAASQSGVAPVQALARIAVQRTHAPELAHTGRLIGQSASVAQARQAREAMSQTGVSPVHAASFAQPKAPPFGATTPIWPAVAPVQPVPAAAPLTENAQPDTEPASTRRRPPPPPPPPP